MTEPRRPRRLSLRTRILLLVIGVALFPLLLIATWITGMAARSGEALLRERLREAVDATAGELGQRWLAQRSLLLDLAEDPALHHLLGGQLDPGSAGAIVRPDSARLLDLLQLRALDKVVTSINVRDRHGQETWSWSGPDARTGAGSFAVTLDVRERMATASLGTMVLHVPAAPLLAGSLARPSLPGVLIAAFDRGTGASLLPLPVEPSMFLARRFTLVQDEWIAERRVLADPPVELVAAAPLTPFTQPFQLAARRGAWALLGVATAAVLAALWLTSRMTGTLDRLVEAAEGISRGELRQRVSTTADDELGRVAVAFNTMAENLDSTLAELAEREALAAVGAFAAELAHEVRNPLTAIRVNMQVAQERLPADSAAHEAQHAALEEVDRLERTVSGALKLARSGRVRRDSVDLAAPLEAALRGARPVAERRGARLRVAGLPQLPVHGDPDALQQMLLNLLVNAVQAVPPGGVIEVEALALGGRAVVHIRDEGTGIPDAVFARVREPFFSTRRDGTGLGLCIADRIVRAHGGELRMESETGVGTTVEVDLPLHAGPAQ